jgi:transposase
LPRFRGQLNACQDTVPEESARAANQTPYPPEFRAEAVRLLRSSGRTPGEVAEELGISRQSLANWARQADRDAGRRDDGLTTQEQQELRELRRRLRIAEEEREILKKAVAFFVRETGQR